MRSVMDRTNRDWTLTLREVDENTEPRAWAWIRYLWGLSARVVSVDPEGRTVTVHGPGSESLVRGLERDLNARRGPPGWS